MTEITSNGAANGSGRNGVTVPHVNGKATYAELHKVADHFIGGNKLENAPASKVKDFVAKNDGHTVITNVSCFLPQVLEQHSIGIVHWNGWTHGKGVKS
jgi:acetyl-CoA carboxylase / biotin carboxylase 1